MRALLGLAEIEGIEFEDGGTAVAAGDLMVRMAGGGIRRIDAGQMIWPADGIGGQSLAALTGTEH